MTCRVLGVRRQGFYEWCSGVKSPRADENELLLKHIERIHAEYACGLQLVKLQMRPTDHFSLAVDSRAPCDDQTPP